MSVRQFARFIDNFGVEFVGLEVFSKDVGKSSVEVQVIADEGVEF